MKMHLGWTMAAVVLAAGMAAAGDLADYVDPFIGTADHGHTFPGACMPFGMVQLSPDNGVDGWDWCSGYHRSTNIIAGFSHTHLSGTGCFDLADISAMPTIKELHDAMFKPGPKHVQALVSTFSHDTESASPGYYRVRLADDGIDVELTAAKRAGFHRYTYPDGKARKVVFDLGFRINGDNPVDTGIRKIAPDTLAGWRHSKGWTPFQRVYFVAQFSEPVGELKTWCGAPGAEGAVTGKVVKAAAIFPAGSKQLAMRVGISSVSIEGALANLAAEPPPSGFDAVRAAARKAWNDELGRITVETPSDDLKKIFYTAMYHSFIFPGAFSDVDGRYKGYKDTVVKAEGFTKMHVLSLWDTFRALMPLVALVNPQVTSDTINSMLHQYQQTGQLPIWELAGDETMCMIGYHSIPVICEAWFKGIGGFDKAFAYEAMKAAANHDIRGLPLYRSMGYIPCDQEKESISKLVEYCYDDWCIAQVAKSLGRDEDYKEFMKRSQNYRNVFDAKTGFLRGKKADGTWLEPFDPKFSAHGEHVYTEGNAWQWLWFVPHDPEGLMGLLGGPKAFVAKLDQLFTESPEIKGENASMDISGLIGQYAHGNEPSHHTAYLYNFAGRPDRTQERVRAIVSTLYTSANNGLCGNDDCGQMSAWYVWNALGLYPMNPVSARYELGSPCFDRVTVKLGNGKTLTVAAGPGASKNPYVKSVSLNGRKLDRLFVTHDELAQGGELKFEMSATPVR